MATPTLPTGTRLTPEQVQEALKGTTQYTGIRPPNMTGSSTSVLPNVPYQSSAPPTDINIPSNKINSSKFIGKDFGGILRYPYEALTNDTDYLQIDIRDYNSASAVSGGGLASGRNADGTSRRGNDNFNPNVGNVTLETLSTSPLAPEFRENKKVSVGTILLPMPSNIQSSNSVDFSNSNLDGLTADIYGTISEAIPQGSTPNEALTELIEKAGNKSSAFIQKNGSIFGQLLTQQFYTQAANIPLGGSLTRDAVFARKNGEILNQNVELLFNGAKIRSFKFSFKMTPRGGKEAQQIKLIINAFKRYMVPKLTGKNDSSVDNLFLRSPSIFELTYKSGNIKNPFLNSFKQCFLTDMSVNYTGEGTYTVYNDSTPVSMVLELGFKELEPIYDQDYATANY